MGGVNILVNNAGMGKNIFLLDEKDEAFKDLEEVMQVNLSGVIRCTRAAFKSMVKNDNNGYIININSVWGHSVPYANMKNNVYPATKHAITALTEVLRQELIVKKMKKIRVSVI